jgi:hypothetical protein
MDSSMMRHESNYRTAANYGLNLDEETTRVMHEISQLMEQWRPERTEEEERQLLVSRYFEEMARLFPGKFDSDHQSACASLVQMTDGEAAVEGAVFELWPNGRPPKGLRAKVRNKKIQEKLVELDLHKESPATIRRAFRKMRSGLSALERN